MVHVLRKSLCFRCFRALVIILAASVSSLSAENSLKAEYDVNNYKIITQRKPLELKCTINATGYTFKWKKGQVILESGNGIEITDETDVNQGITMLTIAKPTDSNAGEYVCEAKQNNTGAEFSAKISVISTPTTHLETDHIVVEGEKLMLDCRPTGVPPPRIVWTIDNQTYNESRGRIKLIKNLNNVTNAILQIDEVEMEDRGEYKCLAMNDASNTESYSSSKVRIKDKLAALWPFLGICAEVFVLCFIIFIYEKKRNKAELDESDTDNSPEQKNTPDHGKDSVRQRK